ncbi:hypothetical protein C8F01DRAFT_1246294 [Mycena amicta]|nr:hypothetical protein C8F01DRAFT_1246294 [Mycena amicta]
MADGPDARPAYIPQCNKTSKATFSLYHHGYSPRRLILQVYSCPTNPDLAEDQHDYSLPSAILLQFARALANNLEGKLHSSSEYAANEKPVEETVMLIPGEYTYVVDKHPPGFRWPICPSFKLWKPAPAPAPWGRPEVKDEDNMEETNVSALQGVVKDRGRKCLLTGRTEPSVLDAAHVLPQSEEAWFAKYSYTLVGASEYGINSANNLITLSHEVNGRIFDAGDFVLYPWKDGWIVLWTGGKCRETAFTHNFRQVAIPARIPGSLLWARLIWTAFQLARVHLAKHGDALEFVDDTDIEDADFRPEQDMNRKRGRDQEETEEEEEEERPPKQQRQRQDPGDSMATDTTASVKKSRNDPPDLSPLKPSLLPELRQLDRMLRDGTLACGGDSAFYVGFSDTAAKILDWCSCPHHFLADAVAVIGTMDLVFGEVDR